MTEREPYTPTTEQVRTEWIESGSPAPTRRLHAGAAFDRWLAAHDEAVRQEERERIVSVVESWFDDYNGTDPGVGGWYALEANLDVWIREQGKEQG